MLTLDSGSFDWALKQALNYGDTDVFPPAFEFQAISHDWDTIGDHLHTTNVLEWKTRAARRLLAPKGRYSFRVITQLDPLDFLVFAALVYELGPDLEERRIPTNQGQVFSFRFSPNQEGRMFDPSLGYRAFQREADARLTAGDSLTHVAVADISDFYNSIYVHRLENALHAATDKTNHVKALIRLIAGWNTSETFGIPVGSSPSRLLAEITIADVDEALLGYGIDFVRYNDDYRLFGSSHDECFRQLAILADTLYRNHGLSLQPKKTYVMPKATFRERFLPHPEDIAFDSLRAKFEMLVEELDLGNPYEEIDLDELTEEQQELVESLNLAELFREEVLDVEEIDISIARFILRRLAQINDTSLIADVIDNLRDLYPILPDVIRYLHQLAGLDEATRHEVGETLVNAVGDSILGQMEFSRMWALYLFGTGVQWDQEDELFGLLSEYPDLFTKRKVVLGLGRAGKRHFFQSQWRELLNESPWPRRAILAAASCLPADARQHWYRSMEPQLDPLEKAIARWVRETPFA